MKKTILSIIGMTVLASQAPAFERLLVITVSPLLSTALSTAITTGNYGKELMIAAEPDAQLFLASEGTAGKTIVLEAAVNNLNMINEFRGLSEIDKIKLVVLLANQN